jgi:hypothetical protein
MVLLALMLLPLTITWNNGRNGERKPINPN